MVHKILCIDDDLDFCIFLKSIFSLDGVDFVFANDARSGKKILSKLNFDAIILDKDLPDGNGIELGKWIRFTLKKRVPLSIITADKLSLEQYHYLKDSLNVGFILSKPLDIVLATEFSQDLLKLMEKEQAKQI